MSSDTVTPALAISLADVRAGEEGNLVPRKLGKKYPVALVEAVPEGMK